MYMDGVVVYGIAIVLATCVVGWYVGRFAYRHFKQDCDVADHKKS